MKLVVLLIALLVTSAVCWAQSLADVARKERERQRQVQSSATYSNSGTTATVSTTSSSTVPSIGIPSATQAAGPTDNQGRDENYWRTTFQKAREDVKRAEEKLQLLDLKIKDLNSQLLQRSDIYNRENTIGPQITASQAELDRARNEAEAAKQKIIDLEEELRRSGGLPGWAR